MGEEALPVFAGEGGVFGEFPFDHEFFDVVDGVDVGHAVRDDAADLFEAFVGAHGGDGIALNQNIAFGQQLQCFQRTPVGAQDSLSPFHEAFFVPHQVPDLDDIARRRVIEDLDGLWGWHGAREQLDEIAGVEDGGGVVGFAGAFDGHAAFEEVERAGDAVGGEGAGDEGPGAFKIVFAVFGEERCEGGFFGEGAGGVIGGGEGVDLGSWVRIAEIACREGDEPSICLCRPCPTASLACGLKAWWMRQVDGRVLILIAT